MELFSFTIIFLFSVVYYSMIRKTFFEKIKKKGNSFSLFVVYFILVNREWPENLMCVWADLHRTKRNRETGALYQMLFVA